MRLPNADQAIIERVKLEGYVLADAHPVGRFKARFFASLGFTAHNWRELEAVLRSQHLPEPATPGPVEAFGQPFTIRAILKGPGGAAPVTSVWFVRTGETVVRFVTAYPGGKA